MRQRGFTTIDDCGFAILENVLNADTVSGLAAELYGLEREAGVRRREQVYAIRNLLQVSALVRKLAMAEPVRQIVEPVLGPSAFPILGILFDKPESANWKVPWHQDLSIPVKARVAVPGFGPWSVKAGVPHVQPPVVILERLLVVRLHLDDSTAQNGPLRVIPGSHRCGRLSRSQIDRWREQGEETACLVPSGGALLMRPLLLHTSSVARTPCHRRSSTSSTRPTRCLAAWSGISVTEANEGELVPAISFVDELGLDWFPLQVPASISCPGRSASTARDRRRA